MDKYLILMDSANNESNYYKGAICILNEKPWYVTNLAEATIFNSEDEVKEMVESLQKQYPNRDFVVAALQFYFTLVSINQNSPVWLQKLKEEDS